MWGGRWVRRRLSVSYSTCAINIPRNLLLTRSALSINSWKRKVARRKTMARELLLLYKYASLFRELINSKVRSSNGSIKKLLRLNDESDWNFLTAAMDIIDDASSAISHVQEFGLGGPTKYNDIGEKYLRLYGLLSATYIQQEAILTIYRIMNVPNLKATISRFDGLDIRSLRHKLSSHGTDYRDRLTGAKEAYVPLRLNLADMS